MSARHFRNLGLMALASLAALTTCAATFHVSPHGSDANPGTRDRPLATLERARDLARTQAGTGERLIVELADGIFRLVRPLKLDGRDSATTWRAAKRGQAVLSGHVMPSAPAPVTDPQVLARLPEAARGKVVFVEFPLGVELPGFTGGGCGTPPRLLEIPVSIFQGARRLNPARWPNEGFVRTGENIGPIKVSHDARTCQSGVFRFASDRLAAWAAEPDLWADGLWCYEWADAKSRVMKVDVEKGTLSVDPAPIGFGIRENAQFYVMNAFSELDRPGEWVIDRRTRRIYVWPINGQGELSFTCAAGLVNIRGARDICVDGILFECSRTDALTFKDCTNCVVRASIVRKTSAWAIDVAGGESNRVEGCDLYDLGEGGIRLNGGDFAALRPANHVADNNHIHHYGQVVPNYKPGVCLLGVGNRATHNLIHHSRHQGISFGGNDQYIGWNVIHDTCMFNDDAGSIYCCQRDWTKRGTVIERNVVHMTGKKLAPTHTQAVYLDDFSSGVVVRDNIINRADLGVYIGGGQDCLVTGNLILNCTFGVRLGSRGIETFARPISSLGRESSMFKTLERRRAVVESSLWRSRYPNLLRVFDFDDGVFAHNALFNVISNNVCAGCGPIEKNNWQKVGPHCRVENNFELKGDPGFVDYVAFDWNLKPDSAAARRLGALGYDRMGLYASPNRISPPCRFAADVTPPKPIRRRLARATVRIDMDLVGDLPMGETDLAESLRVCDLPNWGRGKRIVANFGPASADGWVEYSFSFVPRLNCLVHLVTMGARGEDTLYDDIRVTGSTLSDGGFETGEGWTLPRANPKDYRAPYCNLEPPFGLLTEAEAGCKPAEGCRMACGNDMLTFSAKLNLKKGVPVTVTFKARAAVTQENRK